MRARFRGGHDRRGGVLGYPLAQMLEEVAFIAYHFHWPLDEIMVMEHADRRHWVEQISAINLQMNESGG